MKRLVLAVCVLSGLAFGQKQEDHYTGGRLNCRGWNFMTDENRLGVIIGYNDLWGDVEGMAGIPEAAC